MVNGSSSAYRGIPGFGVYSATKAALRQFVRVWAAELTPRGVRVNIVVPGPTDTDGLHGAAPEEFMAHLATTTSMSRLGSTDEIAAAVLFLSTAQSSFILEASCSSTAAKFRSTPEHRVLRVLAGANEVMKELIARSL